MYELRIGAAAGVVARAQLMLARVYAPVRAPAVTYWRDRPMLENCSSARGPSL